MPGVTQVVRFGGKCYTCSSLANQTAIRLCTGSNGFKVGVMGSGVLSPQPQVSRVSRSSFSLNDDFETRELCQPGPWD